MLTLCSMFHPTNHAKFIYASMMGADLIFLGIIDTKVQALLSLKSKFWFDTPNSEKLIYSNITVTYS